MIKIIYSTYNCIVTKTVSDTFNVRKHFEINYNLGIENKKYIITYRVYNHKLIILVRL